MRVDSKPELGTPLTKKSGSHQGLGSFIKEVQAETFLLPKLAVILDEDCTSEMK